MEPGDGVKSGSDRRLNIDCVRAKDPRATSEGSRSGLSKWGGSIEGGNAGVASGGVSNPVSFLSSDASSRIRPKTLFTILPITNSWGCAVTSLLPTN